MTPWLETNLENCGRIPIVSDANFPVTLEEQLRACRAELEVLRETRRQAAESQRESEEQYRLLVENAGDGIFIAQEGRILFVNRRALQMAGYEHPQEVLGRSIMDFIHPEDRSMVADRHMRRQRGEQVPSTYPLRMKCRDGTTFWTQLNAVAIDWKGRPASLSFIRDITEQKQLEEQLAAAERMRSIGTLAGGIAHDFNNILMGIQGNVSLLLLSL